jgi:hypothetical protein
LYVDDLASSVTVSTTILLFVGEELLKDVLSLDDTSKLVLKLIEILHNTPPVVYFGHNFITTRNIQE